MQNSNSKFKIKISFKFLAVVFSFAFCVLSLTLPRSLGAASGSLYLTPSSGTYTVDNIFSVEAKVNGGGVSINAAQGSLLFPADKLSVTGISKSGSIFTLWTTEPTYSNSSGTISFGGGLPNPGYAGSAGKIITISFRVKTSGVGSVGWNSGAVLANDGKGTNILASMAGGNYTLRAVVTLPPAEPVPPIVGTPAKPVISSSTHPEENKWYSNSTVKLSWALTPDIDGVSTRLDQDAIIDPGPVPDGLFDSKIYTNVSDGAWYFHLKVKNKYGWSPVAHRKILIDTTPPHPFSVAIKEGERADNPQPILLFEAKDDTSGIDYYEIKVGEGDFFSWTGDVKSNPFKMPLQAPGKRTIIVKALDKAVNNTAATVDIEIAPIESPMITYCPTRITAGEPLEINGRALPGSTVRLFIGKEEGELIKREIFVDTEGNWSYLHEKILKKGLYSVWGETIDERGAVSYASKGCIFSVGAPVFIKIGKLIIDYLSIMIVLIVLILIAILGIYWVWHRLRLFRKRLRKETKEVDDALRKAFGLLKEEMSEQLRKLEKIKGERKLTKEEEKIEKELKRDLDVAENYIKKEIEDVEEELRQGF